jgi:RNA polymerase subunit RPABC4/transcription elongation factor Spt4
MTIRNQTGTRFTDEIRIVSPWVRFLSVLVFLLAPAFFVVVIGMDRHAPPFAIRALLGALAGAVLGCYVVLIGYINQDAGRRSMSRLLWTLIAIFVPNGLGVVLYFVLRKPRTANCAQCDAKIESGYSFCPRCRNRLQPVCPHCQRSVNSGDKFCPYCGGSLEQTAGVSQSAAPDLGIPR